MFEEQITQVSAGYVESPYDTRIVSGKVLRPGCVSFTVALIGVEHVAWLAPLTGEITWLHNHPRILEAQYAEAEEMIRKVWELVYQPVES